MHGLTSLLAEPLAIDIRAMPMLLESITGEIKSESREEPKPPPTVSVELMSDAGDPVPEAAHQDGGFSRGSLLAVVPLSGVVTRHGYYAAPGTLQLGRTLQSMDADPAIGTVVLSVNSPGGSVYGTTELAGIVRGIRDRGETQVVSVADPLMASAATWIATAASEVYATVSADVGSIGVISAYTDFSEMLQSAGIKVDVIRTPDLKARFTGVEPLTEDMRNFLSKRNNEAYAEFLSAMAENRGVSESHVSDRFGGGEVMSATAGVEAGLIDGIATLDEVVAGLMKKASENRERRRMEAEKRRRDIQLAELEQ